MLEIEVKIKLQNQTNIEKKILGMGCKPLHVIKQIDIYYNSIPNTRDFGKTDEALRVRSAIYYDFVTQSKIREDHDITYKGPKLDPKVKTRTEYVCPIMNADQMDHILLALGYLKVLVITKERKVYEIAFHDKNIEICLDQVDGLDGVYLEAEIMAESKQQAPTIRNLLLEWIQLLGYSEKDSIRESYLELLLHNQK